MVGRSERCSGPGAAHTTPGFSDGAHTFAVRATDAVGNVDATPPSRSFTVDTTVTSTVPPPAADTTRPEQRS
jgi:hypothetical protein